MPALRVIPQPRISLAAMKGGSGKTTTALNLAGVLALQEKRVLLVDLDPQTNLSTALNVSIKQDKLGVRYLLTPSDYRVSDCAYPRGEFLDLVPADPDLGNLENEILMAPDGRLRLRRKLEKGAEAYDFIIIDCPPSIGALTQSALIAATDVIIR